MAVSPTQPQPYCGLRIITVDSKKLGVAQKRAAALRNRSDALLRKADRVVSFKLDSKQSNEVSFSTGADRMIGYELGSGQSKKLSVPTNESCDVVFERFNGEIIGKAVEVIDLNNTSLGEIDIVKRIGNANAAGFITYAIKRGSDSFVLIVELVADKT